MDQVIKKIFCTIVSGEKFLNGLIIFSITKMSLVLF